MPAGRPKGALNKKTKETVKRIINSGLTPLDYMMSVVQDESFDPEFRMEAAKAAAPYVHSKRVAVEGRPAEFSEPMTETIGSSLPDFVRAN
jgi:hypothetical protein